MKSAKNFLLIGVAPLLGALVLGGLLVVAVREFIVHAEDNSETGATWLGVAPPLVIGIGFLLLGALLMTIWRVGGHPEFFGRRPETVPTALAESGGRLPEATTT